jgi:hypothetical protein
MTENPQPVTTSASWPRSPIDPDGEARKAVCGELAQLLAGDDGLRLTRLLQLTGTLVSPIPPSTPTQQPAPITSFFPIGPWKPTMRDGQVVFVRDEALTLADVWAPVAVLQQRKQRPRRVCLIGESVAAGYLYAPEFTCAHALARYLDTLAGPGSHEVVDLTRLGLTGPELVSLAIAAMQLQPDILVVFAGNNWAYHHAAFPLVDAPDAMREVSRPRDEQGYRQTQAQYLRAAGLRGLCELAAADEQNTATAALAGLAEIRRISGVHIVLVVPEVNLADWETRHPVAWLPGDGVGQWHQACHAAEAALHDGDGAAAAEAAERMLLLDQGSCPTSHRLLAIARRLQGRWSDAAAAARDEVSISSWHGDFLHGPRVSQASQAALRRGAARFGFGLVDLPAIFAEHTEAALPDRRLFLDYCHLTEEGIAVAMAATAAEVARLEDGAAPRCDWRQLAMSRDWTVPPAIDARAKFAAAIHNAHLNLAGDHLGGVIRHWCAQALAADPQIAAAMADFLMAKSSRCPPVLTSAHQRVYGSPFRLSSKAYELGFLEVELIDAISGLLDDAGYAVREPVERELLEQFGLREHPVDLAHRFYRGSEIAHYGMAQANLDAYRAVWPVSRFYFLTDATRPVALALTVRLPHAEPRDQMFAVTVNAGPAHRFKAQPNWTKVDTVFDPCGLRRGINTLTIEWPATLQGAAASKHALAQLEMGLPAKLFPVFGEVFSLRARVV